VGAHVHLSADDLEAQRVAQEMGFGVEVIVLWKRRGGGLTGRTEKIRKLALELHRRKWSASRIARALKCCERSVERWVAAPPANKDAKG